MLPCVIVWVLKHVLAILVFKVYLVTSLKVHISTKDQLVSIIMDVLLYTWVRKVCLLGDVFWDVGDVTETLDLVTDVIIFFRAVLSSNWIEAFDNDVVIYVCFNCHGLASYCEEIFFDHKLDIA